MLRPSSPAARARAALAAAAVALGVVAVPAVARAQSITVQLAASPPRVDALGAPVTKRALALRPEGVNLLDCQDNLQIEYSLQVAGFAAGQVLQVWAGTADCTNQDNRLGATTQKCWQVTESKAPSQLTVFRVPVRNVIYGLYPERTALSTGVVPNDPAVCGTVDLQSLQLYFLLVQGVDVKAQAKVDIEADTVGPPQLDGLSLLPGNNRVHAKWNLVGEGGISDLTGVRMYCAPAAGGDAGAATVTRTVCETVPAEGGASDAADPDAAAAPAGEVDAGCREETVPATCDRTAFGGEDGAPLLINSAFENRFQCGEIGGNFGASLEATAIGKVDPKTPIVNYNPYAVFVVATDSFGNPGTPSDVLCMTPEETKDFWSQYRQAGGQAGGCTLGEPGTPGGAAAVLAGLVATALARVARRKRS